MAEDEIESEPEDAEHGDVPEDLLVLFEVLEWEAASA